MTCESSSLFEKISLFLGIILLAGDFKRFGANDCCGEKLDLKFRIDEFLSILMGDLEEIFIDGSEIFDVDSSDRISKFFLKGEDLLGIGDLFRFGEPLIIGDFFNLIDLFEIKDLSLDEDTVIFDRLIISAIELLVFKFSSGYLCFSGLIRSSGISLAKVSLLKISPLS
ncbi:hypothetical protein WICMUC_002825 [Wickerhamomyces mucosus]|uniref:Uncharacterized protein n=1 Tax=Wickerhamomyces mucosus TaxID=1378264 RepID=A0A9P8TDV1_9ASCO|nr:hypothetical protein WICMUC_002825 [Wickerhamomyces mucosus]